MLPVPRLVGVTLCGLFPPAGALWFVCPPFVWLPALGGRGTLFEPPLLAPPKLRALLFTVPPFRPLVIPVDGRGMFMPPFPRADALFTPAPRLGGARCETVCRVVARLGGAAALRLAACAPTRPWAVGRSWLPNSCVAAGCCVICARCELFNEARLFLTGMPLLIVLPLVATRPRLEFA